MQRIATFAAYGLIGLAVYQPTINALIKSWSFDARLLSAQLETLQPLGHVWEQYNQGRPAAEQHHSTVYVPRWAGLGAGEDISEAEARTRLARLNEKLATAKRFSPLHRVGVLE